MDSLLNKELIIDILKLKYTDEITFYKILEILSKKNEE